MFFQNLKTMKSCIDELLDMNESDIDSMLSKATFGHDMKKKCSCWCASCSEYKDIF